MREEIHMEHTPEYEALFKEYFKLCSLAGEACVELELSEDELRQRVERGRLEIARAQPGADGGSRTG